MLLSKLKQRFVVAIKPPYRFRVSSILVVISFVAIMLAWWRDHARLEHKLRLIRMERAVWSEAQARGEPDTPGYGDIGTAWASATQDGQTEWLLLSYKQPVKAKAVVIHETYNPGAVFRITSVDAVGQETILWEGTDPTPRQPARGVSNIPIKTATPIDRIRVFLDSQNVIGWNEIDAVGLVTADGNTMWAEKAKASSSYGGRSFRMTNWPPFTR